MSSQATARTLLPVNATPPRSKTQPYYSIHPLWQDVTPIPQSDMLQPGQSDPGPALATIAYTPRYSEAMSYLRAVMAENEVSERALALTEDLIGMNPAHYTVWIYRMSVLKGLWGRGSSNLGAKHESEPQKAVIVEIDDEQADQWTDKNDDSRWTNIQAELSWLNEIATNNLKNYQIWHHRHALADLLPQDPSETTTSNHERQPEQPPSSTHNKLANFITSEQHFLAQILSLDTKNYHVWSYRQWLCTRFPSFLLPTYKTAAYIRSQSQHSPNTPPASIAQTYTSHPELLATTSLITSDIRNNSAWSHRFFLLFGHIELTYSQIHSLILKTVTSDTLLAHANLLDTPLIEAETQWTQAQIRLAPMNGSAWNYLRGILLHGAIPQAQTKTFCEEFVGPGGDLWADQYEEGEEGRRQTGVRSSHAVEWLGEILLAENTEESRRRGRECFESLAQKWDPIRARYWNWRVGEIEKSQKVAQKAEA